MHCQCKYFKENLETKLDLLCISKFLHVENNLICLPKLWGEFASYLILKKNLNFLILNIKISEYLNTHLTT